LVCTFVANPASLATSKAYVTPLLVLIAFCTMSVTGWSEFRICALLAGVIGRGAAIDAVSVPSAAVVVDPGCVGLLLLQAAAIAHAVTSMRRRSC